MIARAFHGWERRLASVTTDRVVRPFEWGLDWLPRNGHGDRDPARAVEDWVSEVMADTDAFYTPPPTGDYTLRSESDEQWLTFPSALVTPHAENNTVRCRYFPRGAWRNLGPPFSSCRNGTRTLTAMWGCAGCLHGTD